MRAHALTLCLALTTLNAAAASVPVDPVSLPEDKHAVRPAGGPQAAGIHELDEVSVIATLDRSRNALSPVTGSSQYELDIRAIAQLPLGAATPINQVLLQAPGVVQDAHGGLHVRGDHGNLQYRINGVIIPESIGGFGQSLDARMIQNVKLLDGALPAQFGLRTAAVVDITTRSSDGLGNGGSVGATAGSQASWNPAAASWGGAGRWSWFLTGSYLTSDAGIENPEPTRRALHDHTNQAKGFGSLSYLVDEKTRVGFLFGVADNRFEIPNRRGEMPAFGYLDRVDFDSATLDSRQREDTRFGVLSLQGERAETRYQVALGQRYSALAYTPDPIGELMFSGIAGKVGRSNRASTLQMDLATPIGYRHTLRYGAYGAFERAANRNDAQVFPSDADGHQTATTPIRILDASRRLAATWSAYVQDEWNIDHAWTLNYGLRADHYRYARDESQLSPRIGAVWQVGEATTFHAGYARYFTPPSTELIGSASIEKFAGTTNAVADSGDNTPLAERAHYFDVGIAQEFGPAWTVGLDAYYRKVARLQDEGQFGSALVYSTFNYADGQVKGVELSVNYEREPLSAYFNLSLGKAIGRRILSSQYNFDPDDLAYVAEHWIFLDHSQRLTSSGGVAWALAEHTRVGADYLFGSGLRRDGTVPNGAALPAYFQLNLSLARDFHVDRRGPLTVQLAVLNALDRSYALRDGSGIGVGAPQFGPRRGVYVGVHKDW